MSSAERTSHCQQFPAQEAWENNVASLGRLCQTCAKLVRGLSGPLQGLVWELVQHPDVWIENRRLLNALHYRSLEEQIDGMRSGCGICSLLWEDSDSGAAPRDGGETTRPADKDTASSSVFVTAQCNRAPDPTWTDIPSEPLDIRLTFSREEPSEKVLTWLTLALSFEKTPSPEIEPGNPDFTTATTQHSTPGCVWPAATPFRAANSTRSRATLDLAKSWLEKCRDGHSYCGVSWPGERTLPTRLIDIGSGTDDLRLYRTPSKVVGKDEWLSTFFEHRYVALSHCWGTADFVKLSVDNYRSLREGFSIQALPRTWQDAIAVSRFLGYGYIWIDALCIIQDCEHDVVTELERMHEVYGDCDLNIAALGAGNSHHGLFSSRRPVRSLDHLQSGKTGDLFSDSDWPPDFRLAGVALYRQNASPKLDDRYHRVMQLQPLNSRGWVMQERALSPRTLYFGGKGIYWDCLQTEIDEYSLSREEERSCNPHEWEAMRERGMAEMGQRLNLKKSLLQVLDAGLRDANVHRDTGTSKSDILSGFAVSWADMMSQYCQSKLTFETDRMRAVSAIARLVGRHTSSKYLAGLWEISLPANLAWAVLDRDQDLGVRYHEQPSCPRGDFGIGDVGAPSFSWASLGGRCDVRWYHLMNTTILPKGNTKIVYQADIVSCESPTADPFVAAHGCSITMRCSTLEVTPDAPMSEFISATTSSHKTANPGLWQQRRASEHPDPRRVVQSTTHLATVMVLLTRSGQHTDLTQYCLNLHRRNTVNDLETLNCCRVGLTMIRWRHPAFEEGLELPQFAAGMKEETISLT